ncbi:rhodanese-like domain-containing protein [Nocardioides sp.]|uniref:rhodanese-like domain-containing protein n=1 Tax=Nocardioides sp. TaxID=35761 RepID=UPI003568F9E3
MTRTTNTRTLAVRTLAALAATVALLAGATACSEGEDAAQVSIGAGATAAAAPEVGASLSSADFAAAANRPGTVLLDVRTPQEFAEGHLTGAINIDLENQAAFTDGVAGLDPQQTYAVYCRSGNRSAVAMAYLAQQGFSSYYDLGGGISDWIDAGGQVVQD